MRLGFGYFCPMAWPRLYHMPSWVAQIWPGLIWRKPDQGNAVYLTFDDGPSPEVTPWLLETLQTFSASATWFCVGANAAKYPDLLKAVLADGHQIGNHTQHHKNAWQTPLSAYLADVKEASNHLRTSFFRPPYGKLTPGYARKLKAHGYEVIMWDILSYDFDPHVDPAQALLKCIKYTRAGSIVVFHDHPKAMPQLKAILIPYLRWLWQNGYQMSAL